MSTNNGATALNFDVRAHAYQFLGMHKAVFEDVFGDDGCPFGLRCQRHVLRLHVSGKPRIFFRADVSGPAACAVGHADSIGGGA